MYLAFGLSIDGELFTEYDREEVVVERKKHKGVIVPFISFFDIGQSAGDPHFSGV